MIYTNKETVNLYDGYNAFNEGLYDLFNKVKTPVEMYDDSEKVLESLDDILSRKRSAKFLDKNAELGDEPSYYKSIERCRDLIKRKKDRNSTGTLELNINITKLYAENPLLPGNIAKEFDNAYTKVGYTEMPKSKNILKGLFQEKVFYKIVNGYIYIINTQISWELDNFVFSNYSTYTVKMYSLEDNEKSRKRLNLNESTHTSIFESVNI